MAATRYSSFYTQYNSCPLVKENLAGLEHELIKLRTLFPKLARADFDREFVERIRRCEIDKPPKAEQWGLIPAPGLIGASGEERLLVVLDRLKQTYSRLNTSCLQGLGPNFSRQHTHTAALFHDVLVPQQKHTGIILVPFQFGQSYAGCPVREVRQGFDEREFGLDPYQVGMLLLTHPERLCSDDDPGIDCAGGEYDSIGCDEFQEVMTISYVYKELLIDCTRADTPHPGSGTASGFIPRIFTP